MPRSLFRKEAIDAQRQKFLGEASVAKPVALWVYTTTACAIAAAVVAIAVWGHYTRRERVQGYLTSAVGAADVRMPDAGTVTDVLVKEGDVVTAGAPMVRLRFDRSGVDEAAKLGAMIAELDTQIGLLGQERAETLRLGQQRLDQSTSRIANLETEVREADAESRLQGERLDQARQLLAKWIELKTKDYASDYYVLQYQNQVKDQEIKVQTLARQRASIVRDLAAARADLPTLRSQTASQVEQIDQKTSAVRQTILDRQSERDRTRRDLVVVAPIDGTVTNIGPATGQTVAADAHFATLLPKDRVLHAELLVPTRAIGFVRVAQPVVLRYEAFPYERFGQYRGTVESVGRTTWSSGDTIGPLSVREPVYRIVVGLQSQDIAVADQRLPLQAGMIVSADLLMERRTLVEWLFQPVLQLRHRIDASTASTASTGSVACSEPLSSPTAPAAPAS